MKKKRKLKIAIFHLAFFYSGGGEKLVLEEIGALRKQGHEVDCYSPVVDKKLCFPDIIGDYRIKTFFPRLPRIFDHQETIEIIITCFLFPLIAWRFKKYDVIFAANQPSPWLAWLVKKFTKVPYVIYLSQPTRIIYPRKIDKDKGLWMKNKSYFFPFLVKLGKPFISWIDNFSIRGADQMLADGVYMEKILKKIYKRNATICPAGAHLAKKLDSNRWKDELKANGFHIQKPYILLTNRHFPHKKFEYAINAMPSIIKKFPKVKLIVTGNTTDYTRELKELVEKLRLTKNILFTGFIRRKDLEKLYTSAAVYVYTSPEEDFGMGVIESMASSVPVVAWNKAGPSTTILNGKTGFLIKPYSQRKFTNKIIYLLEEIKKNKILGKNAYKHIAKNYTFDKHNQLLEETLLKYSKQNE